MHNSIKIHNKAESIYYAPRKIFNKMSYRESQVKISINSEPILYEFRLFYMKNSSMNDVYMFSGKHMYQITLNMILKR